jgi:hypothetical protein
MIVTTNNKRKVKKTLTFVKEEQENKVKGTKWQICYVKVQ